MNKLEKNKFATIERDQIPHCKAIDLYFNSHGSFILYKPAGANLSIERFEKDCFPELFMSASDRLAGIKKKQLYFMNHLKESIHTDNVVEIKDTLVNLVGETLKEPRSGTLSVLPDTVSLVVDSFSENPEVMNTLFLLSTKDYTTAMHSINVMAIVIGYCNYIDLSVHETNRMALMALLHDVGKTEISTEILQSDRKLNSIDFELIKSHPNIGAEIILGDPNIADDIAVGALEHHEKLDGSGYPNGLTDISFEGRLIGIIDCYEAMTTDDRPYRRSQPPLDVLHILKQDVKAGKLDMEIFKNLCLTLCTM